MNVDESIRHVCNTVSLAYRSISNCRDRQGEYWHYQIGGAALLYVRRAVVEQLKRDGYTLAKGFDQVTGDEIITGA